MIISIIMILIWIIGTAEGDFERLCDILENVPEVKFICLDVANGYSQFFVEYVVRILLLFFQKNSWNCIKREKWFFFCRKKYVKLFPLIRYSLGMSSPETWLRLWSLLELILLRLVFSSIFFCQNLIPFFFHY